ncbi:MAG TPA: M23 family metallopeptidase [Candidatus Competibacteraceae bacterium]|nr:M23 family metallopeptidase [Candidatus Competibacteraceae bacterium]
MFASNSIKATTRGGYAMGEVTWPLEQNVIRGNKINHTFGMVRKNADGTPKPHQGWDFKATVGTNAYAIADGKIEFVKDSGAYGKQICLSFTWKDQKTRYAFYAHMNTILVSQGQQVTMNTIIGTTGKSGNAQNLPASEDHLHFEIRTKANAGYGLSNRLSPLKIFGKCPLLAAQDGNEIITF